MALKDYRFRETDWERLRFNVMDCPPDVAMTRRFPELGEIEEFKTYKGKFNSPNVTNSQVLKYIILMYDPNTPLMTIEDYFERKCVAAEAAGFKMEPTGRFVGVGQAILNGSDPHVGLMIMRYLSLFHSIDLTYMQTLFRVIHEKLLKEDVAGAKKAIQDFREVRDRVTNGDNSPQMDEVIYRVLMSKEDVIKTLRPEHLATAKR